MKEKVVLGIGSNLGRRLLNLKKAIELISESGDFNLLGVSGVYETEPWGYKKQNKFLNCSAAGFYRASPDKLFKMIKSIEKKLGRKKRKRWHSREIDIDILFFGSRIIKRGNIEIPHPQIQNRKFVLKPLLDLMPDYNHPLLKKKIRYLYRQTKDRGEVKLYKQQMY
ncbi:MAG: 2-amino-4-hydroxy-6-hydroxymethyldihydropteridine diphosphokinase [Ignavibacteria bacterium]